MADVIGVVGDVKHRSLDETPTSTVYRSSLQEPSNSSIVVVRSSSPAADVITVVREEVDRLDSKLPANRARPTRRSSLRLQDSRLADGLDRGLQVSCSLLLAVLSMIGLFGIGQRTTSRAGAPSPCSAWRSARTR